MGNGFAVGDLLARLGDRLFHHHIRDRLLSDLERRQHGHAVFEQRRERPRKLPEQIQFHHLAKHRRVHFPLIQPAPSFFGGLEALEEDDQHQKNAEHQPPILGEHMADANQHLRNDRQRHVHPLEDRHESRQHVGHEEKHDAHADRGNERRINQC